MGCNLDIPSVWHPPASADTFLSGGGAGTNLCGNREQLRKLYSFPLRLREEAWRNHMAALQTKTKAWGKHTLNLSWVMQPGANSSLLLCQFCRKAASTLTFICLFYRVLSLTHCLIHLPELSQLMTFLSIKFTKIFRHLRTCVSVGKELGMHTREIAAFTLRWVIPLPLPGSDRNM